MPEQPFTLYRSESNGTSLTKEHSQKLLSLPLNDGAAKVILNRLIGLQDHVIIHTASSFSDGSQPLTEEAQIIKIDDSSSSSLITEFHSTGGKLYSYGVDEHRQYYAGLSEKPGNADGSYTREVLLYDEQNNRIQKIKDYQLNGQILTIHDQDKKITFKIIPA